MDSRLLSGIGAGPDSGSYTDLNRLNQLKVGKDRDGEANIRKVAQNSNRCSSTRCSNPCVRPTKRWATAIS